MGRWYRDQRVGKVRESGEIEIVDRVGAKESLDDDARQLIWDLQDAFCETEMGKQTKWYACVCVCVGYLRDLCMDQPKKGN